MAWCHRLGFRAHIKDLCGMVQCVNYFSIAGIGHHGQGNLWDTFLLSPPPSHIIDEATEVKGQPELSTDPSSHWGSRGGNPWMGSPCLQSFPARHPAYERWTPDTCLLQGQASGPHRLITQNTHGLISPAFLFPCIKQAPRIGQPPLSCRVLIHSFGHLPFATCPGVVPGICFLLHPAVLTWL